MTWVPTVAKDAVRQWAISLSCTRRIDALIAKDPDERVDGAPSLLVLSSA